MAIFGFELEEIVRLVQMLEESGLDEIVFKDETRYLRLRGPRPSGAQFQQAAQAPSQPRRALPAPSPAAEAQEPADESIALISPMMGMFYRSDKPGGPPLVSVGQPVAIGQVIGIIEAMKIFSEVLAEHSGIVASVPAEDGKLVQAGEPLIILRKED